MEITEYRISVRDLTEGYTDNQEEGVLGFGGRLNIRPPYQREFIYKEKQRNAVIDTVRKGFPLSSIYWVDNGDSFEVLDGQQRTISICQYVAGDYSIDFKYFHNLEQDEKDQILNYELFVYKCSGEDSERLDWFETINIAGEKLTSQELLNANYTGLWLSDAKGYFSRTGGPAAQLATRYIKGSPIRQDYLAAALKWISNGNEADYMAEHQHSPNANELWLYFQTVINWVKITFPNYRREMKGVDWGTLYNRFKNVPLDSASLEHQIRELMIDDDITRKSGIYSFLLTEDEKHLNIRAFSASMKRGAFERQSGVCPHCTDSFDIGEMEADHILPWIYGGKTNVENLQLLCKACNRTKSSK